MRIITPKSIKTSSQIRSDTLFWVMTSVVIWNIYTHTQSISVTFSLAFCFGFRESFPSSFVKVNPCFFSITNRPIESEMSCIGGPKRASESGRLWRHVPEVLASYNPEPAHSATDTSRVHKSYSTSKEWSDGSRRESLLSLRYGEKTTISYRTSHEKRIKSKIRVVRGALRTDHFTHSRFFRLEPLSSYSDNWFKYGTSAIWRRRNFLPKH